MSDETTTSKKSFLTNTMEKVAAKKAARNSDDYENNPTIKAENARFKKVAVLAAVGCTALLTAAILISNRVDDAKAALEETTPEDETDTEV